MTKPKLHSEFSRIVAKQMSEWVTGGESSEAYIHDPAYPVDIIAAGPKHSWLTLRYDIHCMQRESVRLDFYKFFSGADGFFDDYIPAAIEMADGSDVLIVADDNEMRPVCILARRMRAGSSIHIFSWRQLLATHPEAVKASRDGLVICERDQTRWVD